MEISLFLCATFIEFLVHFFFLSHSVVVSRYNKGNCTHSGQERDNKDISEYSFPFLSALLSPFMPPPGGDNVDPHYSSSDFIIG